MYTIYELYISSEIRCLRIVHTLQNTLNTAFPDYTHPLKILVFMSELYIPSEIRCAQIVHTLWNTLSTQCTNYTYEEYKMNTPSMINGSNLVRIIHTLWDSLFKLYMDCTYSPKYNIHILYILYRIHCVHRVQIKTPSTIHCVYSERIGHNL